MAAALLRLAAVELSSDLRGLLMAVSGLLCCIGGELFFVLLFESTNIYDNYNTWYKESNIIGVKYN